MNMTPSRIVMAWLLFILSFAAPPLLLFTTPYLVWTVAKLVRQARYLARSRDAYLAERDLLAQGKFWGRA